MKLWRQTTLWIEVFVITAFFIGLGFLLNPKDPFFVHGPFPWIWFAPVLVGLRYGVFQGIFSFISIGAVFILTNDQPWQSIDNRVFFSGGLLLTLLCVIYKKTWKDRVTNAEVIQNYIQERIENIANSYNSLLFSHDRLEESLISSPVTLRSALEQLRKLLVESHSNLTSEIADRFMQLLSYYCSLESAGLYLFKDEDLETVPKTQIGNLKELHANDPLLKECITKKVTTFVAVNELENNQSSYYLVVAPLLNSADKILGVVVVQEMPFLALNEANLKTLAMLLTYFSDSLTNAEIGKKLLEKYPGCPITFAAELFKLKDIQKRVNIDSIVVCWHFRAEALEKNVIFRVERERRGLDSIWRISQVNSQSLLILMPLSNQNGVAGYFERMKKMIKQEFDIKLPGESIKMTYQLLSSEKDPLLTIEKLLDPK